MKQALVTSATMLACVVAAPPLWAQEGPTPLAEFDNALTVVIAQVADVEANLREAPAGDRTAFQFQRRQRWQLHHAALGELVTAIEAAGVETVDSAIVARAIDALEKEIATVDDWLGGLQEELSVRRVEAGGAPEEARVGLEVELSRLGATIDEDMRMLVDDYEWAEVVEADAAAAGAAHDSAVVLRTKTVGALLEQALAETADYRARLSVPGIDTVSVHLRLAAVEERVRGATTSLQAMTALMTRSGRDASEYRQLTVTATGRLSTEVLDTQVLGGLFSGWGLAASEWLKRNLGLILLRFVALAVILFLAGRLSRLAGAAVGHLVAGANISSLIKQLMISGSGKAVWLVALLVVLWLVGIDLGPALAGLGVAGIVLGFALQDTLANFAAGLMIMIYTPFDVDDFVTVGGVTGKVRDLTMVSTLIQTMDNKRIIVPNGKVWGDVINNDTAEAIRRVDLVFGIHYDDDVDRACAILERVIAEDDRVLAEPEPLVRVGALGASSVDLICRPWCRTEHYWDLQWDLTRAVKKRFDAEGVTFPFPQRDVHVYHEGVAGPTEAFASGKPSES